MHRTLIASLCAVLFAGVALGDPLLDDEQVIVYSQIPKQETTLHPRMAELMGWAVDQDEQLVVLSGLLDIARLNITELTPSLVKLLDDPRPLVQTTAIQTVGALDAKGAADALLRFVELKTPYQPKQIEQVQMSDALLSRWKDTRGVPHWTARLADAATPTPLRHSAARALGAGIDNSQPAAQALSTVVLNDQERLPLRLIAAQSLGSAVTAGLEGPANLLIPRGVPGRLMAAELLRHHSGAPALDLLTKLANDPEPAVQAPAMLRLLETEPQRLWPTASQLIASPDPKVRLYMVRASLPWHDTAPVELLGKTLDDPHPEVRNEARTVLQDLAKDAKLNEPIKVVLRKWLEVAVGERKALADYEPRAEPDDAPHWRAAEQAAILTGDLDDKPANPLLLSLMAADLEHPRLETRVAIVDAIRKLHVAESRPHIVDLLKRLIDRMEARQKTFRAEQEAKKDKAVAPDQGPDSKVLEITAQTIGVWDVDEADPHLRRLIPKHPPSNAMPRARGSAIWALGLLHAGEGEKMEPLGKQLEERLYDQNPLDPEAHEVRLHSAIAIARMKIMSLQPALEDKYANDSLEIKAACRWGIHHMTGNWLEELRLEPGQRSDGFIQPLD